MATEKSYKDIWEAAREGGLLEVQSFIDVKGIEVDGIDPDRRTALHWAAAGGHNEIVKYLLSRGAARDPVDEDGWSPLMSAVSASKEDVVDTLLEAEVDVNRSNDTKNCIIHYAASKGNLDIFKKIMKKGAKASPTDKYGNTALHRACGNVIMKESDRLEMVKLLLSKTSPNKKNNRSETPLHIAVVEDNRAVALLLVNEGADVLIEGEDEKNSLELARFDFRDELLECARRKDRAQ
ncbi:ankyrin repeat-containing protein [Planoprotostelium fungivorum]|uniref:Ankyrin repeat-containing protein n=1 Tax=Planoprotostelium fungivorum TaxID=1890364 RepID=A0A2P6N4E8_9EUKA|nr:ankyrin repeat-containing protein [Planoprotostelium fungivorum]